MATHVGLQFIKFSTKDKPESESPTVDDEFMNESKGGL